MKFSKSLYLVIVIFFLIFFLIASQVGCGFESDVNERQSEDNKNFESLIEIQDVAATSSVGYFYYPFRDYPIDEATNGGKYWKCIYDFGNYSTNRIGYHSGEDWKLIKDDNEGLGKPVYSIGKGKVVKVTPWGDFELVFQSATVLPHIKLNLTKEKVHQVEISFSIKKLH